MANTLVFRTLVFWLLIQTQPAQGVIRFGPTGERLSADDPSLIRVYIDSQPGPDVIGFSERQQSGKDLAAALAGKKKLVTIVDEIGRASCRERV